MRHIVACADPFPLDELAARIRASSNFRFNWQFYDCGGIRISLNNVRHLFDMIVATAELHRFLRDSAESVFEIEPIHEHCKISAAPGEFESTLAAAANDHLGAYSIDYRKSTTEESGEIRALFGCLGAYDAYELVPGHVADCPKCRSHNSHLFCSWFYGVAWDWCLFAAWPSKSLLWVGCLSDTD